MSTPTLTEPARHAKGDSLPIGLKVTQARVIRSEWHKFWSLRSSWIALAAGVAAMIGFGVLFAAVTANRWPLMRPEAKAAFDATATSLRGYYLVQLIVGVLGVLVVTGEYSTGMIRSSLAAVPHRLPVLWAKTLVFAVITFVVTTASSFVAFFAGQALLSSQHIQTTIDAPGVLRAVIGTGLYLTGVGVLGVGLGWILRHTAGAIATLFGLLLILPALSQALPSDWQQHVVPYLPNIAGGQVAAVVWDRTLLAPWVGFAVFCAYIVVALAAGAVLLRRRDA
jgi:ABC-2 type transport system permease protein